MKRWLYRYDAASWHGDRFRPERRLRFMRMTEPLKSRNAELIDCRQLIASNRQTL